jgi:carbon storage regulator
MLVLSRKQNERIRVGESVVLTVVRVGGDKVRLGIEAPPSMRVLRDELEDDEEEVELALTSTLPHPLPRVLGFVG